jgi:hypothetical protein
VIIRATDGQLLLIPQPDHAALSGAVMAAWQRNRMAAGRRDHILLATSEHDNGWREEDAIPLVDAATGRILDFIDAPVAVRQRVWPRGVGRLASTPYAAALVAQHALTVYDRYRTLPAWTSFFERMEGIRADALRQAVPLSLDNLQHDYFFVRMGDLISLTFCNGWREPQRLDDYELRWDGRRLVIKPDPFEGQEVRLSVAARPLPNQRYRSADEAGALFHSAAIVALTGVALGAP